MKYNREIHHRRSMRLKGFDYSRPGFYFITICKQNRDCLFGDIWPPFERHLWHRDFFDRIIRDQEELEQIRDYIINNPSNWDFDEDNPINIKNNIKSPDP